LARKIGALGLDFQPVIEHAGVLPSSDDSISTESESECKEEDEPVSAVCSLPDKEKFPLLHTIFSVNQGHNAFNRLLKEIVQFSGTKAVKYAKGNPEFRSLSGYAKEFKRDNCMLVETVNSIAKSAKCHPDEACETVLTAFFDLHQDSFLSVGVDKGISNGMHPKVMDEVSVEAMLSEAGVNWTNARLIFRHLKQFFGKSLAVSEKKRQAYFGGNDFPPSVDRIL
jgi:hypothetical protein